MTAVLCAALAASAAACGTGAAHNDAAGTASARPSARPTDPLSGLSNDQILVDAVTNLKHASSVTMSGNVVSSGQGMGLNVTLETSAGEGPAGCQGSISLGGQGSFQFLYLGKVFWIKPDKRFFTSQGMTDPTALSMLHGKWIETPASDSTAKDFSQFCDPSQMVGPFSGGSDPGIKRGPRTTIDGVPVEELTDPGQSGALYVSVTKQPEIVQIVDQEKEGGTLTFTSYNQPVHLAAPPASETIDGSKVGM
ncbi:MAG: hypothetical protein ABSF03_13350 [Streptosporangiaceae bacterium]